MSAVAEEVKPEDATVTPELSVKEQIVAKLDNLPVDRLQQLLDFAEFLENKVAKPQAVPEVAAPETSPTVPTVPPKGQPKPGTYKEEKGFSANDVKGGPGSAIDRLRGSLAHLNIKITEEDIAEARREMWGNFPRESEQIWGDYLLKEDKE
jgi:hypothetical protein